MFKRSLIISGLVLLSACDDKTTKTPKVYDVTLTNVTAGQPLSPPGLFLHGENSSPLWQVGVSASVALEKLAEGGDASDLQVMYDSSWLGSSAIPPGQSHTFEVRTSKWDEHYLSLATMLVNTNDAFTGISALEIGQLAVGEKISARGAILDAGTEYNSEGLGDIPGPAAGGEGFSEARDDVGYVAYHPGVVTSLDGLADSVLTAAHKFDQGAVTIQVVRRQ